jgi:putative flippase GtrA
MVIADWFRTRFPAASARVEARLALLRKAFSFAVIGLVNTGVDAAVFFLAYTYATSHDAPMRLLTGLAELCNCGSPANVTLVVCNMFSWFVAVTGSYLMNSTITFAAETGRRLTWRAWAAFLGSGVLGAIANTTTLVVAAQFIPVWAAKGCAILVSFLFNFSMSHFVVFRPRAVHAERNPKSEPTG